jgi:hypothetical protein
MAQLGEVLGGMLTDVVQARMAADMLTAKAVQAYRADPGLASLSVPRATVTSLTVKLNFAVNAVQVAEPKPPDLAQVRTDWTSRLEDRIGPRLPPLSGLPAGDTAPAVPEVPVATGEVDASLGGDVEPLVKATVSHLLEGRGRIPRILRDEVTMEVRSQALAFADGLRQQQVADVATRSSFDVEVVADKVSAAPPETLQTLEVTFSVDDLEEVLTMPAQWG